MVKGGFFFVSEPVGLLAAHLLAILASTLFRVLAGSHHFTSSSFGVESASFAI
jgi:hypothetical protein